MKRDKKEIKKEGTDIKEDDNKEKIDITDAVKIEVENEKPISKEQAKKESKVLVGVAIVMLACLVFFLTVYFLLNSSKKIEYDGVDFEKIKIGELTFYSTSLPVMTKDGLAEYTFNLRTDPRVLGNVPLYGRIHLESVLVLNASTELNCNGQGIIAISNLADLYALAGTKVVQNDSIGCDDIYGKYNFIKMRTGNETKIVEYGIKGGCYNLEVNNCEILKATERIMLEILVGLNKEINR